MKTSDNYWKLFNILPGRKFEFLVNSKPATDGAWTVSLDPLTAAAQSNLRYDRWVDDRKAMVDRASSGQIGYLHIKAMDAPSLAKFQRELLENQDKKALIIDERFNGGGGIDQELLEILNQRKTVPVHAQPRFAGCQAAGAGVLRPAWWCCRTSAPPATPRCSRTASVNLGSGKMVGVPTMGAVIGTGSFTLMDGSRIPHARLRRLHRERPEHGKLRRAPGRVGGQHAGRLPERARSADRESGRNAKGRDEVVA